MTGSLCDTEEFIQVMKAHQPVWKTSHRYFGDVDVYNFCWEGIASLYDLPSDTLKKKWYRLKSRFRKEIVNWLKKNPGKNVEDVQQNSSSWCYFDVLFFLKDHIRDLRCINFKHSPTIKDYLDFEGTKGHKQKEEKQVKAKRAFEEMYPNIQPYDPAKFEGNSQVISEGNNHNYGVKNLCTADIRVGHPSSSSEAQAQPLEEQDD